MSENEDDFRIEIGHNGGPAFEDSYPAAEGFVAIARSMRDHPIVGFGQPVKGMVEGKRTFSRSEAWQDLIFECRYTPGRIMNGGKAMTLKRGQLVGAVSWLANEWNWSPKTVRTFLDRLEDHGMIERGHGDIPEVENCDKRAGLISGESKIAPGTTTGKHKGKQAHIITICKYALYQLGITKEGQTKGRDSGQMKGKQGANEGQHIVRKEQGKKETTTTHTHRASTCATFPETVAAPTQMVDSDGTYYGISIELTPEKHASWRDRFHALSGTWPSPLMAADSFLAQEFSRQGIVDPKSREARIITYLDKRNTEAAALQAAVSTTAIVKPTPNRGYGSGSSNKPDWNALLDQTMGAKP